MATRLSGAGYDDHPAPLSMGCTTPPKWHSLGPTNRYPTKLRPDSPYHEFGNDIDADFMNGVVADEGGGH